MKDFFVRPQSNNCPFLSATTNSDISSDLNDAIVVFENSSSVGYFLTLMIYMLLLVFQVLLLLILVFKILNLFG